MAARGSATIEFRCFGAPMSRKIIPDSPESGECRLKSYPPSCTPELQWNIMNGNMTIVATFGLGFVGSLAPEIVRLYTIRADPSKFNWSYFYILVSVLFASLGGIVATVLPATTSWGALYAGISTPAVINVTVKRAASSGRKRRVKGLENTLSYFNSFIGGL